MSQLLEPKADWRRNEEEQSTSVTVTLPDHILDAETADELSRRLEPYTTLIWIAFKNAWTRKRRASLDR